MKKSCFKVKGHCKKHHAKGIAFWTVLIFFPREYFKIRISFKKKSEKYVSCIQLEEEGTLGRKSIEKFSK